MAMGNKVGISKSGATIYQAAPAMYPPLKCSDCGRVIWAKELFTRSRGQKPHCGKCVPFEMEPKEDKRMAKKTQATGKGFDSADAIRRMGEIENDMRKHTVVERNCMVVFKSDSDDCLDGAVIFLRKGDNTTDARNEAERMGGVKNAHLVETVPLPESFDEDSVYWNHVYGG